MNMIIKSCHIVSPYYSPEEIYDVKIESGKIKKIDKNIDKNIEDSEVIIIDGENKYLFPGFIDMHCSISIAGYEYINDVELISYCAAKAGFTSITCNPKMKPVIDNRAVVDYLISKGKSEAKVNIYPYGSMSVNCEGEKISEIGAMALSGIVGIADGDHSVSDSNLLRNVMKYSCMFDLPVITHCEDEKLSGNGVMNEGFVSTDLGLKGIPKEAEEVVVARNIVLAMASGARLHIAHVSTKGSLELIREAKKRGGKITCETSPHYFMLTDEAVLGYNTLAKVNPPFRAKEDVEYIKKGLADGTIDVIASGHSPSRDEHKKTSFDSAAWGISSLETTFPLTYSLVESGYLTLLDVAEKLSLAPARILGFKGKGVIKEGFDADLTLVDLNEEEIIDAKTFISKSKYSPFDGMKLKGVVKHTIVGGKIAY